jgi:hypothetical protein
MSNQHTSANKKKKKKKKRAECAEMYGQHAVATAAESCRAAELKRRHTDCTGRGERERERTVVTVHIHKHIPFRSNLSVVIPW